jgi:hypothetical protein
MWVHTTFVQDILLSGEYLVRFDENICNPILKIGCRISLMLRNLHTVILSISSRHLVSPEPIKDAIMSLKNLKRKILL